MWAATSWLFLCVLACLPACLSALFSWASTSRRQKIFCEVWVWPGLHPHWHSVHPLPVALPSSTFFPAKLNNTQENRQIESWMMSFHLSNAIPPHPPSHTTPEPACLLFFPCLTPLCFLTWCQVDLSRSSEECQPNYVDLWRLQLLILVLWPWTNAMNK